MIKDDGTVIHFKNPKVQAAIAASTFCISGKSETKRITELMPDIINQLGQENMSILQNLAAEMGARGGVTPSALDEIDGDDEDVPGTTFISPASCPDRGASQLFFKKKNSPPVVWANLFPTGSTFSHGVVCPYLLRYLF